MRTAAVPSETVAHGRLVAAASVGDVPPGWVLKVRVGNREIALANTSGTFTALENACTHAGGPLGDNRLKEGCYIECPWHNAVFDARTGDVVRGPARKAAKMYDTTVLDGIVYVAMD
jgi:nitrite reductase/ring-hydroxylating ferredoxin subunit